MLAVKNSKKRRAAWSPASAMRAGTVSDGPWVRGRISELIEGHLRGLGFAVPGPQLGECGLFEIRDDGTAGPAGRAADGDGPPKGQPEAEVVAGHQGAVGQVVALAARAAGRSHPSSWRNACNQSSISW